MTPAAVLPIPRLPRHPHRFRLARAGIHQVWQYDEIFTFGGGRLLLRGKNGAGKSKALEMLLPYLLDGDARRIDATGAGLTSLRWLMLDGWAGGTNRLGFLWLEFARTDPDGQPERMTVGAAIKASTSTNEAKAWYFITGLSATDDLALHDPARRPSLERLRELVRPENYFERAADYRVRLARDLFGVTDLSRYRNLVHLLHGLRRPTIGDRIEAGELAKVLTEALPPLDDDVLDEVARNLDDLDAVRAELARLEKTDAALTTFLTSYRGYLRGVLRARVTQVRASLEALRLRRREAGDAERRVADRAADEEEAAAVVGGLEAEHDDAAARLRALRDTAAYRALGALQDRRATVEAMTGTARTAWRAAGAAQAGEADAAGQLGEETDDLGAELTALRNAARTAARQARGAGVDEALFGTPPPAAGAALAAASAETATDVDGREHRLDRPGVRVLEQGTEDGLAVWRARLQEAGTVVQARTRAADALGERLAAAAKKQAAAEACARDVDRLDEQLAKARDRQADRGRHLLAAGARYLSQVQAWAAGRAEADVSPLLDLLGPASEPDGAVEEQALDRELPQAVRECAHGLLDPVLADLDLQRDHAVAGETGLAGALAEANRELARWRAMRDPEPPRSPYAAADRDPRTGAPFFLLADFADGLGEADRAGLEAALEASGLLGAWVCADGTVVADDIRDVVLRPGVAVSGRSLADALRPAPPDGSPVSAPAVARLLAAIGLGPSGDASWIAPDGRWRLGVAHGAHAKRQAEYVGAGARAATRARAIAELTVRVGSLEEELAVARAAREDVERRRQDVRRALRELPDGRDLAAGWTAYEEAAAAAVRVGGELAQARRAAEQARAVAVQARQQAAAQAGADGLPADAAELADVRRRLTGLRQELDGLIREAQRLVTALARHRTTARRWEEARGRRETAEQAYAAAYAQLDAARAELRTLEQAIGANEQEILRSETAARERLRAADTALPSARRAREQARDDRVRAETERDAAARALAEQEQTTIATSGRLRRPLGLPGLILAADLGELEEARERFDAEQGTEVRGRIAALRTLADAVDARLGPARADVGDSAILRRGEELRDGLAGGFDASIEEADGIKRFELHDDSGAHDVAVVCRRIAAAAEDARRRLSGREQEVFERYLLGELGDHLARQVLAAQDLVAAMNDTLEDVRTSHGIGARLVWELPADADADVRAAADQLRQPSAMRTREQSDRLRAALRGRIEQARQADPSAGYGAHLRTALDYRAWHSFSVRVVDSAAPDRYRVLGRRTALSQGEQRVVSYVVLFAAAAAHFTSIGRNHPAAPRLILLDDAFAKVDEPTHANLLGLLVDLDLDFVCTSERLWGCFPTVPSLHIYECLREPGRRGVALLHYSWDGRHKRLVSV